MTPEDKNISNDSKRPLKRMEGYLWNVGAAFLGDPSNMHRNRSYRAGCESSIRAGLSDTLPGCPGFLWRRPGLEEGRCRKRAAPEPSPPCDSPSPVSPPLSFPLQGRCTSKALYSIDTEDVPDQCSCCSPTRTEPMRVPLRCTNGSVIYHVILNALQCKCSPRKCSP